MRVIRLITASLVLLMATGARGEAQRIERPLPFDSAGTVRVITPPLVERLRLAAPAWPITGAFASARLFQDDSGGRVLAVERPDLSVERYALSEADVLALTTAIDAALTVTATAREQAARTSAPAQGAFARNQMLLSFLLYGPLLSSLADDGKTGAVLYLAGTGVSYFATSSAAKQLSVTRAQNHLATDGALRGWGAAAGLLYATGADVGQKTYSALGLAGAIGGAVGGFQYGRTLNDAEAQSATAWSNIAAAAAFGIAGAAGDMRDGSGDGRVATGSAVGAGILGYLAGPNYPKRARYNVTRGDVQLLTLGALLGAAVGASPMAESNSAEATLAVATAGLLGGAYVADRGFVRRFDHSSSEATQVWLGMLAGGLLGSAGVVLFEFDGVAATSMITAGAVLGTVAAQAMVAPRRAEGGGAVREARSSRSPSLHFDALGALLSASGATGRHSIVRVTF